MTVLAEVLFGEGLVEHEFDEVGEVVILEIEEKRG